MNFLVFFLKFCTSIEIQKQSDSSVIEYTPLAKGGGGGLKKNMALGARFQKLRVEPYYQEGLDSQRGLDSRGLPCFSGNVLFL